MTLDEARDHIGDGVVYKTEGSHAEDGVITSVSSRLVFVRYKGDNHSKGTSAADLTLLAASGVRRPHAETGKAND